MRAVVVAMVVAACGGPPDDCERVYDKLVASMSDFHKDEAKWLRSCRAEPDTLASDSELRCTLEADSARAVRRCMHDRDDGDGRDALARYGQRQEVLAAEKAAVKAKADAEAAAKAAADATQRIDALDKGLADLTKKLDDAISGGLAAQNAADRAAALARLEDLRARRAELERRIAEAKAAAAHARGVSKDCIDNPLAKGCP